jgi:hypothetical protein
LHHVLLGIQRRKTGLACACARVESRQASEASGNCWVERIKDSLRDSRHPPLPENRQYLGDRGAAYGTCRREVGIMLAFRIAVTND